MRRLVFVLGFLVACKPPDARPTPSASTSASAPTSTPSAVGSGAHRDEAAHAGAARTEAIVHAWNAAINAHDAAKLGALYADPVEIYGETVARARAIALKKAAFAWHVRDDVDAIAVSDSGRATFHKRSTQKNGKVIDVVGYLDVHDGKIVAEGDTTTDKNLARAHDVGCESAVMALVMATPEAKKAMHDIATAAPSMPEPVSAGGMVLPPDESRHEWLVSVCENHPDRMTCLQHFTVSPATAKIGYEGLGGDPQPIAGEPALAAKARAACKP